MYRADCRICKLAVVFAYLTEVRVFKENATLIEEVLTILTLPAVRMMTGNEAFECLQLTGSIFS